MGTIEEVVHLLNQDKCQVMAKMMECMHWYKHWQTLDSVCTYTLLAECVLSLDEVRLTHSIQSGLRKSATLTDLIILVQVYILQWKAVD